MIIKGLFELVYTLLSVVLTPFQIIPDAPGWLITWTNMFKEFILAPINLLAFFVSPSVIRAGIPILIVILNMEHIWDGIIWILKKLPFVGIE